MWLAYGYWKLRHFVGRPFGAFGWIAKGEALFAASTPGVSFLVALDAMVASKLASAPFGVVDGIIVWG